MIKLLTKVNIIDNSGGIIGRCIWLRTKTAKIGQIIKVSVIATTGNQIQKGDVHWAMIVRTKFLQKGIKFGDNAVILIKPGDNAPIGSRVKGPISAEIKNKKILSLTSYQI